MSAIPGETDCGGGIENEVFDADQSEKSTWMVFRSSEPADGEIRWHGTTLARQAVSECGRRKSGKHEQGETGKTVDERTVRNATFVQLNLYA